MANEIFVPADFPTISAAISAASQFDTIRVAPGTYNETVIVNKTIQLHGAQSGVDARFRSTLAESIVTSNNVSGVIQVTADNVVIDGFTIQNNSAGPGITTSPLFSGYWIFNNIIQNNVLGLFFNSSGLTFSQARHNLIQNNNQAGAATGNGIYTEFVSTNVFIDSNTFQGTHANASINFAAGAPGAQENILISNNLMLQDNSIALTNTRNVKITNNTMLNTQGSSIFIAGGTDRTEIESNILHNSISNGISVNNAFDTDDNTNIRAKLNSIEGNAVAGLNIAASSYNPVPRRLDATNNWWGSSTGPTNPANPGGTGDAVVDPDLVAEFIPFLTANPLPVPPGPIFIQPVGRQASSQVTTYVSTTKLGAVNAAINGTGPLAQAIGNLFPLWPEIQDYLFPTNSDLSGNSQIIWEDFTMEAGEVRFFSQAFQNLTTASQVVFSTVFTDNAHKLYIEEYTPAGTLVQSITPITGLNDGSMSPSAGTTTDTAPPYNWQILRHYSKVFTPLQIGNFIVITVEAVNYNPNGPINPAGVSFVADFYRTNI